MGSRTFYLQSRNDHPVSLEAKRDAMHTYQKRDTVYYKRDAMEACQKRDTVYYKRDAV